MTTFLSQWLLTDTEPGPQRPCTGCGTYGLRIYQGNVICTNRRCGESILHRED
jgi:hypothetical protein